MRNSKTMETDASLRLVDEYQGMDECQIFWMAKECEFGTHVYLVGAMYRPSMDSVVPIKVFDGPVKNLLGQCHRLSVDQELMIRKADSTCR